ncbi:hypothetical protein EXN24_15210 [Rhizobium rhizogenes]|jgi:hypothetical protein|uniref:Uncharacterized protein n=1 Tax=Rhizobium rhizogenes TaxID=359 RepID=A0AA94VDG6_RHIRH|nr:hypothetical protein EXN24_15210 [Rhizobium rhizogenes]CUX01844.1 conserved hypothetical protein [Agrobacterium fabacearum TT111]CVI22355.1 conserved hypothetical protein [Agrobacterium fabacearum CFBP 5771]
MTSSFRSPPRSEIQQHGGVPQEAFKSPVSCIEEHGVRMIVSSTRYQSIDAITFFVKLFFRRIFY